jgi:hypothetical protein
MVGGSSHDSTTLITIHSSPPLTQNRPQKAGAYIEVGQAEENVLLHRRFREKTTFEERKVQQGTAGYSRGARLGVFRGVVRRSQAARPAQGVEW